MKIRILPFSFHNPKISSNLKNLVVSSLTSTICSTFLQACPLLPTRISTGFVNILRARFYTFLGKVAENITVCLWGRTLSTILVIWGSKPKSNILSASSMTNIVTLLKFVTLPLFRVNMSIILPGVQMIISAPFFKSESCFWIGRPP